MGKEPGERSYWTIRFRRSLSETFPKRELRAWAWAVAQFTIALVLLSQWLGAGDNQVHEKVRGAMAMGGALVVMLLVRFCWQFVFAVPAKMYAESPVATEKTVRQRCLELAEEMDQYLSEVLQATPQKAQGEDGGKYTSRVDQYAGRSEEAFRLRFRGRLADLKNELEADSTLSPQAREWVRCCVLTRKTKPESLPLALRAAGFDAVSGERESTLVPRTRLEIEPRTHLREFGCSGDSGWTAMCVTLKITNPTETLTSVGPLLARIRYPVCSAEWAFSPECTAEPLEVDGIWAKPAGTYLDFKNQPELREGPVTLTPGESQELYLLAQYQSDPALCYAIGPKSLERPEWRNVFQYDLSGPPDSSGARGRPPNEIRVHVEISGDGVLEQGYYLIRPLVEDGHIEATPCQATNS